MFHATVMHASRYQETPTSSGYKDRGGTAPEKEEEETEGEKRNDIARGKTEEERG